MYYETAYRTVDNIVYSVDKLRLKTECTMFEFSKIEFRFKTAWNHVLDYAYTSTKPSSFHYNYNIKLEEGKSFWFGFLHNSESKNAIDDNKKYNFTLEFNPNKLKNNKFISFILHTLSGWVVRSFDFAFDIAVNILDIIIDRRRKRGIYIHDNGGDDKTFVVGKGSTKTKIYNKKRESNLDVKNLTRIEVSQVETGDISVYLLDKFEFNSDMLPGLYLTEYAYSLEDYGDTTTLRAFICGTKSVMI